VLLDVTVTGGGTTKVFNLSALPPDAADPSWRWSSTPDLDGRTHRQTFPAQLAVCTSVSFERGGDCPFPDDR
jgi:hypothetical protein